MDRRFFLNILLMLGFGALLPKLANGDGLDDDAPLPDSGCNDEFWFKHFEKKFGEGRNYQPFDLPQGKVIQLCDIVTQAEGSQGCGVKVGLLARGKPLLIWHVGNQCSFRWVPCPGQEPILRHENPAALSFETVAGKGTVAGLLLGKFV